MARDKKEEMHPVSGTIIRAKNGDIMRYDATGLTMVLSDAVIADIRERLKDPGDKSFQNTWLDADILGDIDAWNLRQDGEWYIFSAHLPGMQGVRQFRRLRAPDTDEVDPYIIADTSGPIRGLLSIGGARRAKGYVQPQDFPWHVLSPADEIGAVGLAGTEAAQSSSLLQPLLEMTHDAALANVILEKQYQDHRALHLYVARTETDNSSSITALTEGIAYTNLITAVQNMQQAAKRLGKRAGLMAIGFEFTLEDTQSDAKAYRNGVFDFIAKLTKDLATLGLRRPPILAVFDCGTHQVNDHPILRAQWDLAWQGMDHGLHYVAPGYMFQYDQFGRATMDAIWQMAEMEAVVLDVLYQEERWTCPVFLLAERETDPKVIRVKADAIEDLVIDTSDPFGAGSSCGFSIEGAKKKIKITKVEIAQDDPKDILLTCDTSLEGKDLKLLYAFGIALKRDSVDFPSACGAIRDTWTFSSKTGRTLHRWALPVAIPIH